MTSTTVYGTVPELRSSIGKASQDADALLLVYLAAASRAVDNMCNRHDDGFVAPAAASARTYAGSGLGYIAIDDCVEVTAVGVKESATDATYTAWEAADWLAARGDPERPNYNHLPYNLLVVAPGGSQSHFTGGRWGATIRGFRPHADDSAAAARGVPTVEVTARWGYAAATPEPVKQAVLITASRWFKRGQSSWSDALAVGDFGQLLFQKPLDPDVLMLLKLGRLVRPAVG